MESLCDIAVAEAVPDRVADLLNDEMDFCDHALSSTDDHKVYNIWAHKLYLLELAGKRIGGGGR